MTDIGICWDIKRACYVYANMERSERNTVKISFGFYVFISICQILTIFDHFGADLYIKSGLVANTCPKTYCMALLKIK